jgi:hypothetical protein
MGYQGKVSEREQARRLRAEVWTLQAIADELDVAKSSVSVWVRDVDFTPRVVTGHGRTGVLRTSCSVGSSTRSSRFVMRVSAALATSASANSWLRARRCTRETVPRATDA